MRKKLHEGDPYSHSIADGLEPTVFYDLFDFRVVLQYLLRCFSERVNTSPQQGKLKELLLGGKVKSEIDKVGNIERTLGLHVRDLIIFTYQRSKGA